MHRTKLTRPILLAVASLLASCATTGTAGGPSGSRVTFTVRPTKVGDVDDSTWTIHSHVRIVMSGAGMKSLVHTGETRMKQRLTTTVVAMDGGAVTAVRLHFVAYTLSMLQDGEAAAPGTSPVAGNTYVARFVNGKVERVRAGGAAVSDAEAKILHDEVPRLGVVDPAPAFLGAHTFEKGVPVRVPDGVAKSLLRMRRSDTVGPGGMTLVLEGVRSDEGLRVAIFSTTLTLESRDAEGGKSTARIKGTVSLDPASGRLVASNLTGSVETGSSVQIGPKTLEIKGTGSVTTTEAHVYR